MCNELLEAEETLNSICQKGTMKILTIWLNEMKTMLHVAIDFKKDIRC
jgi:hypothetical protein